MGVGTVWRIAIKQAGSLVSEFPYSWNVRHYITAVMGTDDTPDTLADAVIDRIGANLQLCIAQDSRACRINVALAATPTTILLNRAINLEGTGSHLHRLPTFLAGLIKMPWSAVPANRRWDGKWFQSFLPRPTGAGSGLDTWNRLNALGGQLGLPATDPTSGTIYSPVIWRSSTSTAEPVLSATAATRYYVMRARGKLTTDYSMDLRTDIA